MSVIEDRSRVLLKRGDYFHLTSIKSNKVAKFNKAVIPLDCLIGHKFGSYFEFERKKIKKIETPSLEDDDLLTYEENVEDKDVVDFPDEEDDGGEKMIRQDKTLDGNISNHVTKDEVMDMKAEGVNADEMIKTIVSKNSAFKDRTDYSKKKYIKKKLNRHKLVFQVLKPNLRLITRAVFNQENKKYMNLCPMDVASILYKCAFYPSCKAIVCEGTGGLLISAILENLQENIKILEFFTTEYPKRDGSTFFSFDNALFSNVVPLPVKYANSILEKHTSCDLSEKVNEPDEKRAKLDFNETFDSIDEICDVKHESTDVAKESKDTNKSFVLGPKHLKGLELFKEGGFDCLLLVCKIDPLNLLKHCTPKLAPSRPIVVFHHCLDVIKNCAEWLRDENRAVNIEVSDIFSREYQVLTNRTRPTMKPEETTGFCLSALSVINEICS